MNKNILGLAIIGALFLAGFIAWKPASITGLFTLGTNPQLPEDKLVYAEPASIHVLTFTALDEGFFEKEGLSVTSKKFSSGRLALDAVLTGSADFSSMSETPIMLSILQGNDVVIVASISEHKETKLIARKDKGIRTPGDLKGKRVATQPGTNSDYFMYVFLKANGLSPTDVQIISMSPPDMVAALAKGDIDAFFAWEPYIFFAKNELKDNYAVFEAGNLYDGTHDIVMQRSLVLRRPETVRKMISALLKAEQFVKENREKAIQITVKHTGISEEALNEIFDEYHFEVKLDKSLLNTLDKQAAWAIDSGVSKATQKPDFIKSVYADGLRSVAPERVTLGS